MRNIWAIIVVGLLVGGVGISLSRLIDDDTPERSLRPSEQHPPAANAAAADQAQAPVSVPEAEADFGQVEVTAEDFVLGKADAPVTIVEYASLTCPHCARFHGDTLPGIKKEYIDTGKVRVVYRDFPLDRLALAASMIARCAGRERYFGFIGTFFASQANWARVDNPVAALSRLARLGGMPQGEIDSCLKNKSVSEAVINQRLAGEKTFKINSTPTLIINGRKYSGGLTLEQIRVVIGGLLKKS